MQRCHALVHKQTKCERAGHKHVPELRARASIGVCVTATACALGGRHDAWVAVHPLVGNCTRAKWPDTELHLAAAAAGWSVPLVTCLTADGLQLATLPQTPRHASCRTQGFMEGPGPALTCGGHMTGEWGSGQVRRQGLDVEFRV